MNKKLSIVTTIVFTAATTAVGTYYYTTNTLPENTPQETIAVNLPNDTSPSQVAVNQDPDKPLTIVVKTEIAEKTKKPLNVGHVHDLLRPDQYQIVDKH